MRLILSDAKFQVVELRAIIGKPKHVPALLVMLDLIVPDVDILEL